MKDNILEVKLRSGVPFVAVMKANPGGLRVLVICNGHQKKPLCGLAIVPQHSDNNLENVSKRFRSFVEKHQEP